MVLALVAVLAGAALKPPVVHEAFTPLPCPMHPSATLELEGCDEQAILKSDRAINADARAIFNLLAPSERAGFVAGERAWLRYRRLSCAAEASKYAGGTLAGVVDAGCVVSRNRAHVRDLAETLGELRR
jgi:uncharacterized protein YecT (DUF1311 family)